VLDAVWSRSDRDVEIAQSRDQMAALLADPQAAGDAFRERFTASRTGSSAPIRTTTGARAACRSNG
jgi:hypothetical protein